MLPEDRDHKLLHISVAEKIIADISTGIYRTPAAAIKELIANAYDADATEVEIFTGSPGFGELVIKDNGSGMSIDRFIEIMQHIGGSWKRINQPDGLSRKYKRPLIGRIGIGLLAVAQLGQRFYVSSSVQGSDSRFLAEVDLSQFHKDDAALRNMSVTKDSSGNDPNTLIEIGLIRYVDGLPERKDSHFTVITVPDPKQGLVSEMYGELRKAIGAEAIYSVESPAPSFEDLVSIVQKHKRADAVLDGYYYVMWELGLLAPVKYLESGAFDARSRSIENVDQVKLQEPFKFTVRMDNYDIRRPIKFPNSGAITYGGPNPKIYPLSFAGVVAGRHLTYCGYIYVQQPHIDPVELQGLQIRIRGVGIGGFDRTWMSYPFDEGIKFGQIMGEVFVVDGLESALNIDRASFRETDPHYLALRASIWETLRVQVFPEFKSRQANYRKGRQKRRLEAKQQRLANALESAPESVGVSPSIAVKSQAGNASLKVGVRDGGNSPARQMPSDRQSIVEVVEGEVAISDVVFRKVARQLKGPERDILMNICTVLAAFGIWDELSQQQAEDLINALAVAVSQ